MTEMSKNSCFKLCHATKSDCKYMKTTPKLMISMYPILLVNVDHPQNHDMANWKEEDEKR